MATSYPQCLSHQVRQGGAVRAQFPEGLHLAHLYQDPVETDKSKMPAAPDPTPPAGFPTRKVPPLFPPS